MNIREAPVTSLDDEAIAEMMSALAHPARIAILRHLSCRDACCCKEVVAQLSLAQSTVSQHLKILVAAGLLRYRPEKQSSRYSANRPQLALLARSLSGFVDACCKQD